MTTPVLGNILPVSRLRLDSTLFQTLLTFDAILRPRHCFQTLGVDFGTTALAPSVCTRFEATKGFLDFLQAFLVLGGSEKGEFFFIRARGAVGNVRLGAVVIMSLLRGCPQASLNLPLPRRESLLKIGSPLPIHSAYSS